jgi:hypothetical protein
MCVIGVDNIDTMYTPAEDPATEPEHIARYLAEPIAAAWRCFDRGTGAADEFFAAEEHRSDDPHMAAQIARYEARLSLERDAVGAEWELLKLANGGIHIALAPFEVRVLKAYGAGPPNPGKSHARREFYQQFAFSLFSTLDSANLILYWMVRPKNQLLLGLCKPKGVWRFKGQPKLEWRRPLKYDPLEGLSFPPNQDDGIDVFRIDREELGKEESGE